jgi:hypothetical protein
MEVLRTSAINTEWNRYNKQKQKPLFLLVLEEENKNDRK